MTTEPSRLEIATRIMTASISTWGKGVQVQTALERADALIAAHEATRNDKPAVSDGGWIVGEPTPEMYPVGNPFDVTIERDNNGRRETIGRCWFSADGRIFNSDWCLSKVIAHRSAAPYEGPAREMKGDSK